MKGCNKFFFGSIQSQIMYLLLNKLMASLIQQMFLSGKDNVHHVTHFKHSCSQLRSIANGEGSTALAAFFFLLSYKRG
jgi:hypothetical protein